MPSDVLLYLRTLGRMRPGMAFSRLRGARRVPERGLEGPRPVALPHIAIPELDLDPRYLARYDADALLNAEFFLINERRRVDTGSWDAPGASRLWVFNLHYFEWGVALAARWRETADERYLACFKDMVSSWISSCPYPEGDAWHPYTISLRLINWLVAADLFGGEVQRDGAFLDRMSVSMYRQYRHLLANQETHLRANHWWENLKTLAVMSAAFNERDVYAKTTRRLEGQLEEQVLPDGVHFERSPMYHKLVLEGMLRLRLAVAGLGFQASASLAPRLKAMLDAMASLERGMGKTPFFNDSADGVAKESGALRAACEHLLGIEAVEGMCEFRDAGYYKLYNAGAAVLFDAGEPGPPYMLGHAHSDALSYELSLEGEPVVVNCGSYAYQTPLRPYFRSTSAHNTAVACGEEQLECWAEHRVGRGYRLVGAVFRGNAAEASIRLPSGRVHGRRIELGGDGLRVDDVLGDDAPIETHVHLLRPDMVEVVPVEYDEVRHMEVDFSPEFGVLGKVDDVVITGKGRVSYALKFRGAKRRSPWADKKHLGATAPNLAPGARELDFGKKLRP